MRIQFGCTDGNTYSTDPTDQTMLDAVVNAQQDDVTERDVVEGTIDLVTRVHELNLLTVKGRVFQGRNIVWIEFQEHEWLMEKYPDLPWPTQGM